MQDRMHNRQVQVQEILNILWSWCKCLRCCNLPATIPTLQDISHIDESSDESSSDSESDVNSMYLSLENEVDQIMNSIFGDDYDNMDVDY